MEKVLEAVPEVELETESNDEEESEFLLERKKKLAEVAIHLGEQKETLKDDEPAINFVHDHFPEDITSAVHFQHDGLKPLETEEDYAKIFDLFVQEEYIKSGPPTYYIEDDFTYTQYPLRLTRWSVKDTVRTYLSKTDRAVRALAGEEKPPTSDELLPRADVVLYLDKSARPASWLINEFWSDFTKAPRPRTEYIAVDRMNWCDYFGMEHTHNELASTGKPPVWDDFPLSDLKEGSVVKIIRALQANDCNWDKVSDRITEIDKTVKAEFDIDGKVRRREIRYQDEYEVLARAQREEIDKRLDAEGLFSGEVSDEIKKAIGIAAQLRGLFVPGGLSEEEVEHPELIFKRETGLEGKNITILDEVEQFGATRELAKHFVSWAFPESNVSFCAYDRAEKISDTTSKQDGQMLRIPFWYSLAHDRHDGRGILDSDQEFYEMAYEKKPNNHSRALKFGWRFLGVPMIYETEIDQKSLRFRRQIARFREEYEKGHIN